LWKRLAEAGLLAARDTDRVAYTACPGGRRAKGTLAPPAGLICLGERDEGDERDAEGSEAGDGAGRIPIPHPVPSRTDIANGMEERDAGAGKPGVPGAGDGARPGHPVHPASAERKELEMRTQGETGAERAVLSPDALADEAEVMPRGQLLP
jgi:hypothetical protein